MAGNDTFSLYYQTRPAGNTVLTSSDKVMILQNGEPVIVSLLDVLGVQGIAIDASGGAKTQLLPASGIVTYIKDDNSANVITIQPSVNGQTVLRGASTTLEVQDDRITLQLIGTNWYRVA